MNYTGVVNMMRAYNYAAKMHASQTYGDLPYIKHLESVFLILEGHGYHDDIPLLTAALLHDSLEDTETTEDDLRALFGDEVTGLVVLVTDRQGKNRKERHERTYPLIRGNARATALKLSDRLANVTNCWVNREEPKSKGLLAMYKKEHPEFARFLHVQGDGNESLWKCIEDYFVSEEEAATL
jgi:(p)ppGpp synthase/HD superfamily hydrolase